MLLSISNTPKPYDWGSHTLLADLEGRAPSGGPEAEVWFGDHPSGPAVVEPGGEPLDAWILRGQGGAHGPLPFLLKLLAAGAPLSIQVHPSREQARAGFAREAGLSADDPMRNYRDDNHKPELIVALSARMEALCGLRPLEGTRRLVRALGPGAEPLRSRLAADGAESDLLRDTVGWVLSDASGDDIRGCIGAVVRAARDAPADGEFTATLTALARIAAVYPGDPGVIVALLMNHVVLARGEALSLPAGRMHAYLEGLGVEIMSASDNVLRGGLTSKRVDVPELLTVLDPTPTIVEPLVPRQAADASDGVVAFVPELPDFMLLRAEVGPGSPADVRTHGPAIVLATAGRVTVHGTGDDVSLRPGRAVFVTPDETVLRFTGDGEIFIAQRGRA